MYLSVDCLLDNGLLCIKYNFSYSMFLFKHITPRVIIIGLFLLFAAFSRVFIARFAPDLANFSPVGALALFAGAQLGLRWKSFIMPLSFLILSDILINVWVFEGQYGKNLIRQCKAGVDFQLTLLPLCVIHTFQQVSNCTGYRSSACAKND